VDLGEFMNTRTKKFKRPKELNIGIKLRRVEKVSEVTLDVEERQFILNVPNKYYLDFKLP